MTPPFWIRQMTAVRASQLGVSKAGRWWIWGAPDCPVKCRQSRGCQALPAWSVGGESCSCLLSLGSCLPFSQTAARGSRKVLLNYRITLDPLYPFLLLLHTLLLYPPTLPHPWSSEHLWLSTPGSITLAPSVAQLRAWQGFPSYTWLWSYSQRL